MSYSTGCFDFQYIHERESYEVLLAILEKRKKVAYTGCSNNQSKRPRLHSPEVNEETQKDREEKASETQKATEEEVPETQ